MHTHQFIGNLTRDCRSGDHKGTTVVNFSVAVNNRRTNTTNYVECSLWGRIAEGPLRDYLKTGTKVYIQGEFGTDEYNGNTKITCNVGTIELVGGRKGTSSNVSHTEHDAPDANINGDLDDEIPF